MKLTDAYIKGLKPTDKPSHADGGGLVLIKRPNGVWAWRYRYRYAGKARMLSLGNYPEVGLKQVRLEHAKLKAVLSSGTDPSLARAEAKIMREAATDGSLKAVAGRWFENWRVNKSKDHVERIDRRLKADIFPHLGRHAVREISTQLLIMVIKKIEARGASDVALRAFQTCNQIFRFAVANGDCERNPASDVKPSDFLKAKVTSNYARVDAKDLPQLLRKMNIYSGGEVTRLAMQLMAYVFVRTRELIGARWSEIDLEAGEWRIPAERMKMKDPHIVMLPTQAVEIFKRLQEITGGREFVFPSTRNANRSMSNNTILKALDRMGFKGEMTGHGYRGVASTILHEQGYTHEHIELQLAHAPRNKVSASYNHAKYLPQRKAMLQDWANYLDAIKTGADVIPLHRATK